MSQARSLSLDCMVSKQPFSISHVFEDVSGDSHIAEVRTLRNLEGALGLRLGLVWGSLGAVSTP
eukprot:7227913-Pyramimonas_sp.AAC.1